MIRAFITAWRTLTIIPLPGKDTEEFPKSLPFFPLVGALLGLALFGLYLVASTFFKNETSLTALFLLFCGTLFTGGLHLDGLADVADAFGSGRAKEDIFRILKDPRLGTFGVLALIFTLITKLFLYEFFIRQTLAYLLVSQFVFSKAMMALSLLLLPYAKGKTGIAAPFTNHHPLSWFSILLMCAALYSLAGYFCGYVFLLTTIILSIFPCLLFLFYCKKKIEGLTGDCLGTVNEIYEMSYLIISLSFYLAEK
jgi:adenosylcobinamide-GDP ribazoletransferase